MMTGDQIGDGIAHGMVIGIMLAAWSAMLRLWWKKRKSR
jgi:tetrahydromethanopterin S-methyltransferase subunit G